MPGGERRHTGRRATGADRLGSPSTPPPAGRRVVAHPSAIRRVARVTGRILYALTLQLVLISLAAIVLIYHGPFTKLRESIVVTAENTHAQKYWATWFLPQQEIDDIMARANPQMTTATEDVSAIQITPAPSASAAASSAPTASPAPTDGPPDLRGVTVTDVKGSGYRGKLMTIDDPSRVVVGVSPTLGTSGSRLSQIVSAYHAIGGVNAGGFLDDNFIQNGAKPAGIVITDGVVKWQQKDLNSFNIVGFNDHNVLVVSNSMTLAEIKRANLRTAVSFGPALVVNGKSLVISGGTNLEPRTAIGQRKDGKILLLVIDGRQSSSNGVTYKTVADLMLHYGAYNAANLDGGSSTTMSYGGHIVNNPCDILGERSIPTAILVMPKG